MTRVALLLALALPAAAQTVGEPLPAWQDGYLDIHFINTGRGDAALIVFPDGTSLQVDAGEGDWGDSPRRVKPVPDASRPAGEWLARYARRVLAVRDEPKIDYAFLTHLHGDHMSGYPELAKHVPIGTMLDRGYPDYDYPAPLEGGSDAAAYVDFVRNGVRSGAFEAERVRPGSPRQVRLLRDPEGYPEFETRMIAANGEVWTGVAENTRKHFPDNYRDQPPTENQCSAALRISYGSFDFYTGGDMPGMLQPGQPIWMDVETPVAKAVGPVEVAAANHHGNRDSTNAFFVASLRPRLWMLQVWSANHPGEDVQTRLLSKHLYPDERDILATNMMQANLDVIGASLERLLSRQGHIVVRVEPGGASYRALILEDADESMRVTAVHGPYTAR